MYAHVSPSEAGFHFVVPMLINHKERFEEVVSG